MAQLPQNFATVFKQSLGLVTTSLVGAIQQKIQPALGNIPSNFFYKNIIEPPVRFMEKNFNFPFLRSVQDATTENGEHINNSLNLAKEAVDKTLREHLKKLKAIIADAENNQLLIKDTGEYFTLKDIIKQIEINPRDIPRINQLINHIDNNHDKLFIEDPSTKSKIAELAKVIAVIAVCATVAGLLAFPPAGFAAILATTGLASLGLIAPAASALVTVAIKKAFFDLPKKIDILRSDVHEKTLSATRTPITMLKDLVYNAVEKMGIEHKPEPDKPSDEQWWSDTDDSSPKPK